MWRRRCSAPRKIRPCWGAAAMDRRDCQRFGLPPAPVQRSRARPARSGYPFVHSARDAVHEGECAETVLVDTETRLGDALPVGEEHRGRAGGGQSEDRAGLPRCRPAPVSCSGRAARPAPGAAGWRRPPARRPTSRRRRPGAAAADGPRSRSAESARRRPRLIPMTPLDPPGASRMTNRRACTSDGVNTPMPRGQPTKISAAIMPTSTRPDRHQYRAEPSDPGALPLGLFDPRQQVVDGSGELMRSSGQRCRREIEEVGMTGQPTSSGVSRGSTSM